MGNRLFQEAQRYVEIAENANSAGKQEAISHAKNALSSAYANCTRAEQAQLAELQAKLDQYTAE
ncbi:DUF3813 domain-containing protein [Bacillus mesophilum]|uniref:DUF3813 domain-containing protein n=1 Tax=Bacillus mesophilum TaxID=1071718 RepID=A0A7V7UTL2_9BACI|nr:DUF3813 domain-containing protein [Bacillus mesophilum]KAB2330898.1 DUF3813 domain-containing protein [Bacillus mesophilum]